MSQQARQSLQETRIKRQTFDWTDISGYVTIALGYFVSIFTADRLSFLTLLLFTGLHLFYAFVCWGITNQWFSFRWHIGISISALFILNVTIGFMARLGLGFDWLLYFVTVVICTLTLPILVTLFICILLFFASVGVLLPGQNLSSTGQYLTYILAGFGFVFAFGVANRLRIKERERTDVLLGELEQSNSEREEANKQLRAYADEVEELTVDRERTRMAREIHDTLGHYLTILSIQLETISKLQERDPARAAVEVAEARRVAAQSMQEVRNAVAALRPTSIALLSLPEALEQLAHDFGRSASETELTLDLETQLPSLSPDIQLALYRATQEALTNIRKHAHASKVLIRLRYEAQEIELVVLDNGSGGIEDQEKHPVSGFGLIGLRERVELLGGQVTYGKELPTGYRVTIQIPLLAGVEERKVEA